MADITLLFLSANDVMFVEPSDDSWYSAHMRLKANSTGYSANNNISIYLRDDPVRVLGCTSQVQWCNPNLEPNSSCTPLTGAFPAQALAEGLWQTQNQKALSHWVTTLTRYSIADLSLIARHLGVSSLTSRYKLLQNLQGPLVTNQWQLEMEHWFSIVLADLQRAVVESATRPIDANLTQWLYRPKTPKERLPYRSQVSSLPRFLCNDLLILRLAQKIRNDSFTSFSTIGLVVLLTIGGLIIGISYTMESLVVWIQRRKNIGIYKRLEWTTNETLQLQRLAHEELGFGTWTRTEEDHPITAPSEQLAVLDISEPNHPKLASPAVKPGASSQEYFGNNSTGETIEQGASAADLNHTVTALGSGSTTVDSISFANNSQTSQASNERLTNDPLRHHPTW